MSPRNTLTRPDRRTKKEVPMDADHLQAIAARDQFWSSLRILLPEIQKLADGEFDGSSRQRDLVQLLARLAVAEMGFRADHADPE